MGLTWPSGWKNGAGITPKRAGDTVAAHHAAALEGTRKMRDTLPELRGLIASLKKAETALKRGRPGKALEHRQGAQGSTWTPWELRYTLRRPTPEQLPALRAILHGKIGSSGKRCKPLFLLVPRGGIEPPTRGFSVLCSTD